MTARGVDKYVDSRAGEPMDLESRLALKVRLEKVLSEVLSDQFDCNIKIKFKPEKEEACR